MEKIKKSLIAVVLTSVLNISHASDHLMFEVQKRYMELNLPKTLKITQVIPIDGQGMSSDIFFVNLEHGKQKVTHVLKYPRVALKTKKKEKVPLERTVFEVRYLQFVKQLCNPNIPGVIAHDEKGFLMEYFSAEKYPVLRKELIKGNISSAFYGQLGAVLGSIHQRSAAVKNDIFDWFDSTEIFREMRWDRYYALLAEIFPRINWYISNLEEHFFDIDKRNVLSHGDLVSKNILFNETHPIIIDAEMAAFTPAELDLAFVIVDLLYLVREQEKFPLVEECIDRFIEKYEETFYGQSSTDATGGETEIRKRIGFFLPAMILSRIYGMSTMPLDDQNQAQSVTTEMLKLINNTEKNIDISSVLDAWKKAIFKPDEVENLRKCFLFADEPVFQN